MMNEISLIATSIQEVVKVVIKLAELLQNAPSLDPAEARAQRQQILSDISIDEAIERRAFERRRALAEQQDADKAG